MNKVPITEQKKRERTFLFLTAAALVVCVLLAFYLAVPLQAAQPQSLPDTAGLEQKVRVDLNTADLAALCTLPGVGESLARAILDYRVQNGPFAQVEDAAEVPGLTRAVVDSWQDQAYVS